MFRMFRFESSTRVMQPASREHAFAASALLSPVLFLALVGGLSGCGIGTLSTTSSPVPVTQERMNGRVHGGNQPVKGALIQLWAADANDYPGGPNSVAPVQLLTSTVTTDGSGSFNITGDYVNGCNDNNDPQVYITATGGNPGLVDGTDNSALVLMAALGDCDTLQANAASIFVDINEVSTVASAYALAQFAAPNPHGSGIVVGAAPFNYSLSANPTGQAGLAQAMKTVSNLEDLGTGTALSITPAYKALGGTSGGTLNSSYVPQARINTLANILAACVNTTGSVDGNGSPSQCSALFTAAKSGSSPTPTDTLQAILSIAQHPANNVATLWGISPPDAPFQPSLSSGPADWTLALTFTGAGLGRVFPDTEPGDSPYLVNMAIDSTGNIWALGEFACIDANFNYVSGLYEFDNQGNPVSPSNSAVSSTCGGYQPQFNGTPALSQSPTGLAVDLSGYIWAGGNISDTSGNTLALAKISPDGTEKQANYQAYASGDTGSDSCSTARALAVDGSNDLWVGCGAGNGSTGAVAEINTNDGSLVGTQNMDGTNSSLLQIISGLSLDPLGNLWGVVGSSSSNLFQVSETTPPVVTNNHSTSGQIFANNVISDGAGNVFAQSATPGSLSVLLAGQSTATSIPYPLPPSALGMGPMAVDGAGHIWGASSSTDTGTGDALVPSYLVEMDNAGNLLSPSGTNVYGYTGTGGGGETQPILANYGFGQAFGGIAVDGSGNVWVANYSVAYSFDTASPPGEQLVQFIGLASPTVTPLAQALQIGEVGIRPQVVRSPVRQLRK